MKTAGQGAIAAGLAFHLPEGAWLHAQTEENSSSGKLRSENRVECDVLVVGGGFAGCFAAIKAREQGASVVLVDKAWVGKAGQSPFTSSFICFDPSRGHKLDAWMDYINGTSEYVNNRYWTERVLLDSKQMYEDLVSWGVEFKKDKDGNLQWFPLTKGHTEMLNYAHSVRNAGPSDKNHLRMCRKQAEKVGVKIIDHVMVPELLKQNGRVVGAIGIQMDKEEPYTFIAKTTILCTGGASFKPLGYPPLVALTGDAESMAFRAGAEILGKEFISPFFTEADAPSLMARRGLPRDVDEFLGMEPRDPKGGDGHMRATADGYLLPPRKEGVSEYNFSYTEEAFYVHEGRGPMYLGTGPKRRMTTGGATLGMCLRKGDGLWATDHECRSSLPGLFAAGDAHGSMQNGAVYYLRGGSSCGSMVTGAIAGKAAAAEAAKMAKVSVDEKEVARAKDFVFTPRQRKGGFSPRWVHQLLTNTTMPYFVTDIKKGDRLEATITMVEFMKEHLVPSLIARDPHELRLAHEARSMVMVAEMRLRSALFRTESRGHHYREDFPRRDDANWLAWTKIVNEQDKMKMVKVPMPKEYWPNPATPYREKYPFVFPGEEKS